MTKMIIQVFISIVLFWYFWYNINDYIYIYVTNVKEGENMKYFSKIFKTMVVVLLGIAVIGCTSEKEEHKTELGNFGIFSYNGIYLKEYATEEISVVDAKKLLNVEKVTKTNKTTTLGGAYNPADSSEDTLRILKGYASLRTSVKYYVSGKDEEQVRTEIYSGEEFLAILEENRYIPFGQMTAKYLCMNDEILEEMEESNVKFREDISSITYPFNNPYTYHTNSKSELIVQTHNFVELPASINGGIGSFFRQDCELLFDEEGKIKLWQSSLGLYTSTPTGTVLQGYIFRVDFDWEVK